jgi:hypothetical protein
VAEKRFAENVKPKERKLLLSEHRMALRLFVPDTGKPSNASYAKNNIPTMRIKEHPNYVPIVALWCDASELKKETFNTKATVVRFVAITEVTED